MLSRRSFLETAGLGLGALAVDGCDGHRNKASTRPDIVFLYADDLGYGGIGVQNQNSKIPTPIWTSWLTKVFASPTATVHQVSARQAGARS